MREKQFVSGEFFHIFNKSISGYRIFKDPSNAGRFINVLDYYNNLTVSESFSKAIRRNVFTPQNLLYPKETPLLKFISYCVMPDHYHLLVKILKDYWLSKYMNNVESAFSHFFNIKFERKGPLWESNFKVVRITSNEQLLHVSRYIHLNPTSSSLVDKPEDWEFSSYRDFITDEKVLEIYLPEISIRNKIHYRRFVEDQKDYQRKLKLIRNMILESQVGRRSV